ncbi:heparin lyase I family protein [Streptomyces sp. NA04227]|uniref:heparin lyase I family protein n=1 Tax=Streptomyces sp. NA04227 TaxID=2742136 RepID=UPI00159013D1|nr:heparin lyase I family protein [Streptomyces sp. NA04227]QKW10306.1 heparin lyase I family protein [Streptomyces sp. NA04227]
MTVKPVHRNRKKNGSATRVPLALALAGTLTVVCLAVAEAGETSPKRETAKSRTARAAADLLNVNYQDGSLNSGIPELTTTHATAKDASYTLPSGDDHAVAHKVTLGDPAYESDGAPRSESAANKVPEGVFHVGDMRRYEFSVLLKDWESFDPGDPVGGDILFQGKHAGGNFPSFFLAAKRNAIVFRSPKLQFQDAIVEDFTPYINKWMTFRVDVRWTDDATGFYKISSKLPGESGFTLRKTHENVQTFHPENPTEFGYIKWGLYRPDQSIEGGFVPTRVVHHDNIRVTDLATE